MYIGLVIVCLIWQNPTLDATSLDSILDDLERQEELYNEIEVSWVMNYEKLYPGPKSGMPISSEETATSVRQGGMFRLDRQGIIVDELGQPQDVNLAVAYDGTQTQKRVHDQYGNVVAGEDADWRVFRPHMLPLRRVFEKVPLSVFLRGTTAIALHPDGKLQEGGFVESRIVDDEDVDGLSCIKIQVERGRNVNGKRQVSGKRYFWLAKERNLLPVKFEGYLVRVSEDIPLAVSTMTDLHELQPGVWLPFTYHYVAYDTLDLWENGKTVLSYEDRYQVTDASLDVNYPISHFQDVSLGDIPVYKIGEDGEIVGGKAKSAAVGDPQGASTTKKALIWINLIVVTALVAVWVIRRRQRAGSAE